MAKLWDISQTLRPGLPVWPDDTPFDLDEVSSIGPECPVKVSRMTLSTHSGSHGDAPAHYDASGDDAASLDLEVYLGRCVLITALRGAEGVTLDDLDESLLDNQTRVLIRTYDRFPSDDWDHDFRALDARLIDHLGQAGCRLIGVDAASIDPETSKTMDAHHAVQRHDMRILEGLVFDGVPDGYYELIALPLKIAGADASPVRAILRELP